MDAAKALEGLMERYTEVYDETILEPLLDELDKLPDETVDALSELDPEPYGETSMAFQVALAISSTAAALRMTRPLKSFHSVNHNN